MTAPLPSSAAAGLREVFEELAKRPDARDACAVFIDQLLEQLNDQEFATLLFDWKGTWARRSQLLPSGAEWELWLILAGRGYGKTRTGGESVRQLVESGASRRVSLIGPTARDVRETMVEGESGILALSPPWFMPVYEPSKARLTWPNGVRARLFSAEEPERLRGAQHDLVWGDEPASWPDEDLWTQVLMGLRLGKHPRAIITGTPKPVPLVLQWLSEAEKDPAKTIVTRGNTYENSANLAESTLARYHRLYDGTRVGRQELFAEVLTDMPGALFNQVIIDSLRVPAPPAMQKIIVVIDPAPTSESGSDETGIMVVGLGFDGHGYALEDCSGRYGPDEWARKAIKAYYRWEAEAVVAEINNGGDLVEMNLRTVESNINFRGVRAMRGKAKRAEPVAAIYEQGKFHHCGPPENWKKLERQMRVFTGINGKRDDRTDALCWGVHDLMLGEQFAFL